MGLKYLRHTFSPMRREAALTLPKLSRRKSVSNHHNLTKGKSGLGNSRNKIMITETLKPPLKINIKKTPSKCGLKREMFIGQGLLFMVSTRDMKGKIPINETGL